MTRPYPYPADRPVRWRGALIAAAAGLLAFTASYVLAAWPHWVERVYTTGIWPVLSGTLARVTGRFPFALIEILVALYLLWVLGAIARGAWAALRRQRRWRNLFARGARRAVRDVGLAVFLFYVLWGFNYARPSFEQRSGWPEFRGASADELAALAEQMVERTNRAYIELHGTPDAGEPTRVSTDPAALERALHEGWQRTTELLSLPPIAAEEFGPVKRPLASSLQRLGLLGIYSPFTAESLVPRDLPAVALPHTMAHEKAHQRASTSEAEANFLGFVAASLSEDPLCRYSAAVFASRQLLGLLAQEDVDRARQIAARLVPGVRRDREDLARYFRRYRGIGHAIAGAVNHGYLRANRVRAGLQDYGRSAGLIVTFARTHPGALIVPDPERT